VVTLTIKSDDKQWLQRLPHTAFMSWIGFKHLLMIRLGIPLEKSMKWSVPKVWQLAWKLEARRRG
jgi:hypothetical protein